MIGVKSARQTHWFDGTESRHEFLFNYNNSNNEYSGTNKSEHKRRSPQELKENIGNRLPSINYSRQKMPKLKESTV